MKKQQTAASIFTVAEQARLRSMMNAVWQYIGSDCIQANGGDVSRTDVIELVLDADRLEEQFKKNPEDAALIARFRAMPYKAQNNLAKTFFHFSHYGM